MARTRAERRARRQTDEAAAPPRVPRRPVAGGNGEDGGRRPGEPRVPRPPRGLPGVRFVAESWAELKKVEWPTQSQVIQGTAVVLIACLVVGVYLWLADQAFKR